MNNLPELLAPAGSAESLRAALAAGADAVYFGGTSFSNRMRAKNFSDSDLTGAIRLCRSVGVSANITINTRIRDRETDDVMRLCDTVLGSSDEEARCNAVICADLGLALEIKKRYPHAVLHASTQTSLMSLEDCRVLEKMGFSRLVVPRELTLDEIKYLAANAGIEIEMFIHGAHCVSLSGQCLMSYVMGGRSGNRGECAQPCRLPFASANSEYALSMADMCTAGRIPEIIDSGVRSLKIEGRLKPPHYVYGVTSVYRRLLDERRAAEPGDIKELENLFTRGFTDGYLTSSYSGMNGRASKSAKSEDVSALVKEKLAVRTEKFRKKEKDTIKLKAAFTATPERAVFTITDGIHEASSESVPSAATGKPVDAEFVSRSLTKFGGTSYSLDVSDIVFSICDGLWISASVLNAMRREACEKLTAMSEPSDRNLTVKNVCVLPDENISFPEYNPGEYTCEFYDAGVFDGISEERIKKLFSRFGRVYVPYDADAGLFCRENVCAVLPAYCIKDESLDRMIHTVKNNGTTRVLCQTAGQVSAVRNAGLCADMSYRANITGSMSLDVYRRLGCASVTLSPELPAGALRTLGETPGCAAGMIVYGHLPVMTLARCVICGGKCRKGNIGGRRENARPHRCGTGLTDRTGTVFPVIGMSDCTNIIFNSTPIVMSGMTGQFRKTGFMHMLFTSETFEEAEKMTESYISGITLNVEGRRL